MKKILLACLLVLVIINVSCRKKDDDDDNNCITDPTSSINRYFKSTISSKTFNLPGYVYSELDYTADDTIIRTIVFDNNGLPTKIASLDKITTASTVINTKKIYSTPSSTRGIYYIKASNVDIDGNGLLGVVEIYIGIELQANGQILYETEAVVEKRLSSEQSTISADNVKWNTGQLVGVKSALDSTATETFKAWSLPTGSEGTWVSINTYTNNYSDNYYAEYGQLKISNDNAGDIIFSPYDNSSLTPSRDAAIADIGDMTFYWDAIDKYNTVTNMSYAFSLSTDRYVAINTYLKDGSSTAYKVRIYDVEVINRNPLQIRLNNAKYEGNMYKDLIFEKLP